MPKNQKQTEAVAPEVAVAEAAEDPVVGAPKIETPMESAEVESPPAAISSGVKVRILRDCVYGRCDEVVSIDPSLVESLAGVVDADPAAVEYAESLAK